MGGEACGGDSRRVYRGIERDIWIEEQIELLHDKFGHAISVGDDAAAQRALEEFRSSLTRLAPTMRNDLIADTEVWLGEEFPAS